MPPHKSADSVTYSPGAGIDVTRPLWIGQRLSPEEWSAVAVAYPELGMLPADAHFRSMLQFIMPPEVHDQAGMESELRAVAKALQHYFVIQEYFLSDAKHPEWAVVCRRGEGIGYLTTYIYRLGRPAA